MTGQGPVKLADSTGAIDFPTNAIGGTGNPVV